MKWYYILLIVVLIIGTIIFYFYKMGNSRKVWNHDWLYKSPIAHRGYHDASIGIIENTKSAFNRAIEKGYNIETDISLTKDERIVVFHDDDFIRMCNLDKKVSELTLEEIQGLELPGTSDKIMEFCEFLELISGKTGLLIEFKSQVKARNDILCSKAMEQLKNYKGNYVVQSFDPFLVAYFKKHYKMVPRGQLYLKFNIKEERKSVKGKGFKGFIYVLVRMLYNAKLTNCVSRPIFIDQEYESFSFLNSILRLYHKCIVWTVKDEKQFDKIRKKVDNVIFENLRLDSNGNKTK